MNDKTAEDDAALVARCRQGDASAWSVLVRRYQRLVYAVVRRVGLDEHAAADVFQTVFARLLEHIANLAQPDRLQAWIVTTAKREALRVREKGRRMVSLSRESQEGEELEDDDLVDESPLPEETLSDLQQLHLLRLSQERLDARCRNLLELTFHDGDTVMSYEDVARRLDMPMGSVGPTRMRCIDKLRRLMQSAQTCVASPADVGKKNV